MVAPFGKFLTTEVMPCKSALSGLSQVPNFFVIDLNHRMTMLEINVSNLETWRCQNLLDLFRPSYRELYGLVVDSMLNGIKYFPENLHIFCIKDVTINCIIKAIRLFHGYLCRRVWREKNMRHISREKVSSIVEFVARANGVFLE